MKTGVKYKKNGSLYSTHRIITGGIVRILVKKDGIACNNIRFIKSSGKILKPKEL